MTPSRVAGNVTVSYNTNALAGYLDSTSLEMVTNAITTTTLASTAEEQIAGLTKYNIPVGGPWSSALDAIIAPDALSPPATLRALVVVIGPSGAQVTYTWASPTAVYGAFITDYKIDASSPSDGIKWTGTLAISGAPVRS